MKIFKTLQKHCAVLGINRSSSQSSQKCPLNERVLFGLLLFGWNIFSHFMFILFVANDFMEYMVCICSLSGCIILSVGFASIIFKKSLLFDCIDHIEKFIDSSTSQPFFWNIWPTIRVQFYSKTWFILGCKYRQSKALFLKTTQQVEQMSEFFFMLTVKVTLQLVLLPKVVVSFGTYFITDAGNDSFQLPYPMW